MSTSYQTINADVTLGGSEGTLLANRYRVVRQLGQGGMGSVWLAADTQLDNREVAIKMLPSILVSNKRAYNQLKAEALVSLKLTHPNIAAVRAFEENGGNPFLVVDYIDGQTLDDYLADKGKLSEDEVIRLLGPIASALDYAHGEGVVHRDVKPGNVMIRKDGHPFILDFGIAREIQETMTRVTGKLSSGTLMYMSPEQLHGAAPKASQDVYSFAAMAYECLMGTPPFSRGQIEYQIKHDSPAPIDPQFAKCGSGIMAGLAKSPEDRPVNCAGVLGEEECVRAKTDNGPTSPHRRLICKIALFAFSVCAFLSGIVLLVGKFCDDSIPQLKSNLTRLEWYYHVDDYYLHTRSERVKALEEFNQTKESVGWSLEFYAGVTESDKDLRDDYLVARDFHKQFVDGHWDVGWLKLTNHDCPDNPVWQFYRGVCAEHGYGGEEKNIKKAISWYRKAAKEWCPEALFNMGVAYEFGKGVVKDDYRAACFYYRASLMGDIESGKRWLRIRERDDEVRDAPEECLILNTYAMIRPWPEPKRTSVGTTFVRMSDATGEIWHVPLDEADRFVNENNGEFTVDCRFWKMSKAGSDYMRDNGFGGMVVTNVVEIETEDGIREYPADEKQSEQIASLYVQSKHHRMKGIPKDVLTETEYLEWLSLCSKTTLAKEFLVSDFRDVVQSCSVWPIGKDFEVDVSYVLLCVNQKTWAVPLKEENGTFAILHDFLNAHKNGILPKSLFLSSLKGDKRCYIVPQGALMLFDKKACASCDSREPGVLRFENKSFVPVAANDLQCRELVALQRRIRNLQEDDALMLMFYSEGMLDEAFCKLKEEKESKK